MNLSTNKKSPSNNFRPRSVSRGRELKKSKTVSSPKSSSRYSIISLLQPKNSLKLPRKSVNVTDFKEVSLQLLEKKLKIEQELENILGIEINSLNTSKVSNFFMKSESKAFKDFRQIRKSIFSVYNPRFKLN
jgi:hypothetical protein